MDRFIDRLAKRFASSETVDQRRSRRDFLKRSKKVTAGFATGLVLAGRAATDAEANTPSCCGVSAFSTSFWATIASGGANCRACPFVPSDVHAFLAGGASVNFSQGTNQGMVVSGNGTWYRTSGPIGCWVWAGTLA
jgi:hypothetical protein